MARLSSGRGEERHDPDAGTSATATSTTTLATTETGCVCNRKVDNNPRPNNAARLVGMAICRSSPRSVILG